MKPIDGVYRKIEMTHVGITENRYSRMNRLCLKCAWRRVWGFGGQICNDCIDRNLKRRHKLNQQTERGLIE